MTLSRKYPLERQGGIPRMWFSDKPVNSEQVVNILTEEPYA